MTLRVVELFAGIGAQASALERLGIDFTSTVCEIDDKAYTAYCAIHGPTPNLGDITKVEHLPECDLLTYSFPCQDLSIAGNKKGMEEGTGTRSSLLWEVERLLRDMRERECLPEVLLMENVDAILFKANKPHFEKFIIRLNELGYESSYQVLNAKDYGVPQNRRRCFMVSTLTKGRFVFPEGRPLTLRLRDVLEEDVSESFYLSEERIANYERFTDGGSGTVLAGDLHMEQQGQLRYDHRNRVFDTSGTSPTLVEAMGSGGGHVPMIEIKGTLGGAHQHFTVYGKDGIAPTIAHCDYKDPTKIEVDNENDKMADQQQ